MSDHIARCPSAAPLPAATLRYYEKLGLITPNARRAGPPPLSEATLHRITYITARATRGLPASRIADNWPCCRISIRTAEGLGTAAQKWEKRIDQNIAELKQLKIDLRRCARDASR